MNLITALKIIINFLESEKIPYMVIGGIANSVYGEPRQTFDIDIKIKLRNQINIEILKEKLGEISEFLTDNPEEFAREMRVLPVRIADTKIDLIFADLKYEQDAIDNSIRCKFETIELNICKPEDLIIQKSISDREKDWDDIRNIIKINFTKLDRNYILKSCKELSEWLSKPLLFQKIEEYFNEK